MNKKLLKRIEESFNGKLSAKNSWGKNEVMHLYVQSVNEALSELLD